MLSRKTKGSLCGVFAVLIWAFFAPMVALNRDVNTFFFLFVVYFFGFFVFLIKWLWSGENVVQDLKQTSWWLLLLPVFGIGLHELTYIAAVQNAPPEEATLIIYQWPMLIVVFTALSLGKKMLLSQWVGCFLGVCGLVALFYGKGGSIGNVEFVPGHIFAVISALSWSIYSAISARYTHVSSNAICVNFVVMGVLCALIWIYGYGVSFPSFFSLVSIAVYSVFLSGAYILWDYSMKVGDAQFVAVFSFLVPVLSVFFLVLLGFADFSFYIVLSLMLIVSGVFVAKFGKV